VYGDSFIQSEAYSVRFIPDVPPCDQREQAQFSSECAPCNPGLGEAVLHHESVDARWEYYSVYQNEPGCRPSDTCTCPSVEIDGIIH